MAARVDAPVRVAVARLPPAVVAPAHAAEVASSHQSLREADVLEGGHASVGESHAVETDGRLILFRRRLDHEWVSDLA